MSEEVVDYFIGLFTDDHQVANVLRQLRGGGGGGREEEKEKSLGK